MAKKVLFVGLTDTHLNKNSLDENLKIFKEVISVAKNNGLKVVYHFGDFFTNREGQPLSTLITFLRIINLFEDADMELIAIPGNHDKVQLNSDASYLDIFKNKYFTVISKPLLTSGFSKEFELAFIPYYKEIDSYPEQLLKLITQLDKKKKYVLITHIAVNGVKNNDGSNVTNGLQIDLFSNFYKVFVGHYHNRSQVGDNIFYIGSAFPQNFGEDAEKGFVLFYSDGSHEYHKPKFPEFLNFEMKVSDVEHFLSEPLYKELLEQGNKVNFTLTGEDEKIKSFDKTILTNLGFTVKTKNNDVEKHIEEAANHEIVSFDLESVISFYKVFCEEKKIENPILGIEYLTKTQYESHK